MALSDHLQKSEPTGEALAAAIWPARAGKRASLPTVPSNWTLSFAPARRFAAPLPSNCPRSTLF